MTHIRLACYSDIHHHEYTSGINGNDVEAVEAEFRQLCKDKNVDIWINCGDRFLSRNPLDISRFHADAALVKLSESGIPGVVLVGNHDRWSKSQYGAHNLYNIGLYPQHLSNITVFDTIGSATINTQHGSVAFCAIPAGHKATTESITKHIGSATFNICLFHDIVKGSRYTNGIVAPEGVSPELLDRPEFNIVLGGDNHQPQDLGFKNTKGMYIGAPMQHNWGDIGSERGFLIVDLYDNNGQKSVRTEFIMSSAPKFIKEQVRINTDADLVKFINDIGNRWRNNIVKVDFSGATDVLNGLQLSKLRDKLKKMSGARVMRPTIQFDEVNIDVPDVISVAATPDQEWREYLKYKAADFAGLDMQRLEQMGIKLIIEADND